MSELSAGKSERSGGKGVQILLGVLFVIVLFSLLELGLRSLSVVQAVIDSTTNQAGLQGLTDHPYLTTVMKPGVTTILSNYPEGGDVVFTTNSHGFRSPEFSPDKPEGTFRIVILGGSAVVAAQTNDQTFSSLLQTRLNASSTTPVEVINAGVPTWTSTQELFLLTTEVLDWEPDVVVIYDGRNDLHYGVLPDAQPHWLPRASQQLTYLEDSQNPWRRNFMTFFLIDTLLIHPRDRSHPEADMSNRNGVQWGYQPHQDIVDAYARNLDSMTALLIANDVQPLLIFQPSLLTTSKPLTDLEQDNLDALQPAYIDAMAIMLRDARLAAEEVAQKRAIPWVDFSSIFDDEVGLMLVDDVHQSNAGNEVLARRLGEILSPLAPQ